MTPRIRTTAFVTAVVGLVTVSGCKAEAPPRAPGVPPPVDDIVGQTAPPRPATPSPQRRSRTCGSAGLTHADYDWIPRDARVAITIAVADAETPAALTALAEHGKGTEHGLPITLAFGVTQWPILVPVLGSLLDAIGLQPDEVVYVSPATGPAFAWVVQSDCDADETVQRVERAWGLVARRRIEGIVLGAPPDPNAGDGTLIDPPKGTPRGARPEPAGDAFPFDVVLAKGGRVALVPRGFGDAFLSTLDATQGRSSPGETGYTARLQSIEAAPIRGVVSGRSLMGSKTNRVPAATAVRALPEAVQVQALATD